MVKISKRDKIPAANIKRVLEHLGPEYVGHKLTYEGRHIRFGMTIYLTAKSVRGHDAKVAVKTFTSPGLKSGESLVEWEERVKHNHWLCLGRLNRIMRDYILAGV